MNIPVVFYSTALSLLSLTDSPVLLPGAGAPCRPARGNPESHGRKGAKRGIFIRRKTNNFRQLVKSIELIIIKKEINIKYACRLRS